MKTLQSKLEKIRAEIAALVDERDEVESAPVPREEVAAHIAAMIDAPNSGTLINGRIDLEPRPGGLLTGNFRSSGLSELLDRPGILRALFPSAIQEYLLRCYDAQLGDAKPGLPAPQRRKRLTEIAGEIFRLETDEEGVIEQLEAEGADILRRGDADPRAQLGLSARDTAA